MNLIQLAQIMVFDLVDVSFCMVFALIPFRKSLCSRRKLCTLTVVLYVMVVISRVCSVTGFLSIDTISALRILLYILLHRMAVKSTQPKRMFVLIVMLNFTSFIMILYDFIAFSFFGGEFVQNPYLFRFTLLMAAIFIISLPFIYWMMDKKIGPLVQSTDNPKMWNYIWLAPASFCIIFHYSVLVNNGVTAFSSQWYNVVFSAVINAGSLLVTYMIVRLVDENKDNLNLKTENHLLTMQAVQYENLKNRMEETRIARHDLRHNMTIIKSYLDSGSYQKLDTYIRQYLESLSLDSPMLYCDNYALNAVLTYYDRAAKEHGYEFTVDIQFDANHPQAEAISDIDATVLLGNLLENAVEACARQTDGARFIRLWLKQEKNAIIIAVDNSYSGAIHPANSGFISSKSGYTGTGVISIKRIALKYHGVAKFHYHDGTFSSSVMLNP